MKAFHGLIEDVEDDLKASGIRYGISIGRRAPMHKVHVDCVREIAEAGLVPVILIGSANGAESPLFDPVRNPLTVEQQKEQVRIALPEHYREDRILVLEDFGDDARWTDAFAALLEKNGLAGQSLVHYRVKATDAKQVEAQIRPLSAYMAGFMAHGIASWESVNRDPSDDDINATELRCFDLDNLGPEQRALIAAPDYIVALAREARSNNPHRHLLENAGLPVTVFDLALERFWKEAGITTADILEAAEAPTPADMGAAGIGLHRKKFAKTPGMRVAPGRRMT